MSLLGIKHNADLRILGNIFSNESIYQQSVLDIQTDATLDPGASPTKGDRYILTNTASLNANFGTITGVGDNDIVEHDGSAFVIVWDASVQGAGAQAFDKDSATQYFFNGSNWAVNSHPDGGDGITFNSGANRFDLDLANVDSGLELTASDGSGELRLSTQGNGIAGGAGALLSVDPATEVAGSRAAVYVAADGVGIDLDDSSLTHSSSVLQVKDLGISTAKLADLAVTSDKLAANSVITTKILDANVTVAKIEVLAEGELIVGNGTVNSKVNTSAVGDILSDETNGLTIKTDAVGSDEIAADAVGSSELNYSSTGLRSGAATDAFSISQTRTFTHNWATFDVAVEMYDSVTGETIYGEVSRPTNNTVEITLNQQPTNSIRVMLREINPSQTTISVS